MFVVEILVSAIVEYICLFCKIKKNILLDNLIKAILLSLLFFGLIKIGRLFYNISFSVNLLNDIKWSLILGIGIAGVSLFFDFLEAKK